MIKHIWFDVERTLYKVTPELEEAHKELRYQVFADVLGKVKTEEIGEEYKRLYQEFGANSLVFSNSGKESDFWAKTLANLDVTQYVESDPAMASTIQKLADKVPVSLFTNLNIDRTKDILEFQSIEQEVFTHILTGDDVVRRKPNPEGFYKMIELSKVPADQILYVGDRVETDILPAKKLGMQTCLIYSNSPEADICVEIFVGLLGVLDI